MVHDKYDRYMMHDKYDRYMMHDKYDRDSAWKQRCSKQNT
jgi:hypothetical protein